MLLDDSILLPEAFEYLLPAYVSGVISQAGKIHEFESKKGKRYELHIENNSRYVLTSLGRFLKQELKIVPKIYQPDKTKSFYKLIYGGRELVALYHFIKDTYIAEPIKLSLIESSKGYQTRRCKKCGVEFIRVAGLQDYCNRCHPKKPNLNQVTSNIKI